MTARTHSVKSDLPIKRLSHQELVDLLMVFQSDPNNREAEEKLLGACLEEIKRIIEAYVCQKRFPNLVADEAMDSVQLNLTSKLRKVKSPGGLRAWLTRTSRRAAIDIFRRDIIGRSKKGKRVAEPLEVQTPTGEQIEILDLRANREAAERHKSMMGSAAYADFPENVETRHLLSQLLKKHIESGMKRDRDSAFWVQTVLVDGIFKGEPIDEIAKARGTTRGDVLHLLTHDSRALHIIYRRLRRLT
jgi:DNA-directed RNA polymerase specialized sigma24 family protein